MKFHETPIKGALLIEPRVFGDPRGFFMETWQSEKFAAAGIGAAFLQDNQSRSNQWTLRGLHLQVAHTQGKLVRVSPCQFQCASNGAQPNSPCQLLVLLPFPGDRTQT